MKLEFNTIEEFEEFVELIYRANSLKPMETTEAQIKNERWLIKNDLQETLAKILDGIINITKFCRDNANAIKALQTTLDKTEPKKQSKDIKITHITTKRHYPKSHQQQLPKIRKLNKDGTFVVGRGNGKIAKWDINIILKLKKYIPSDLSNREIAKNVGLDPGTAGRLMFMIETGKFDKYLREWEQMQANQIYNKNRKVPVENNPQKRRENLQGVI